MQHAAGEASAAPALSQNGAVELREDIPLKGDGVQGCGAGGPRIALVSFALLTGAVTVALLAQLRAGDDLGDMLEPPTKVAKIFIPYAMRAKKVDMKQLKHYTWKMLTENERNEENVTPTSFSSIYSRLPSKLSSSMQESLSVPLALLSILHLANEKGLILEKKDNLRDIGIVGLIK